VEISIVFTAKVEAARRKKTGAGVTRGGSAYFPPGAASCIIYTMDDNSRRQIRDSLLADLASARADLIKLHADALRKPLSARSALAIATLAGLGPDVVCESSDGGAPLTVAQLKAIHDALTANPQLRSFLLIDSPYANAPWRVQPTQLTAREIADRISERSNRPDGARRFDGDGYVAFRIWDQNNSVHYFDVLRTADK